MNWSPAGGDISHKRGSLYYFCFLFCRIPRTRGRFSLGPSVCLLASRLITRLALRLPTFFRLPFWLLDNSIIELFSTKARKVPPLNEITDYVESSSSCFKILLPSLFHIRNSSSQLIFINTVCKVIAEGAKNRLVISCEIAITFNLGAIEMQPDDRRAEQTPEALCSEYRFQGGDIIVAERGSLDYRRLV